MSETRAREGSGTLSTQVQDFTRRLVENVERVIVGKREVIELATVALLCEGHILFEDVPGVGKTTLARALARSVGGTFRRIQFTSDLLPSDIVGVSVFREEQAGFEFRPGPIFANVVLADEINRATPRTQSALLEGMEERHVTVEGNSGAVGCRRFTLADHQAVIVRRVLAGRLRRCDRTDPERLVQQCFTRTTPQPPVIGQFLICG